MYFSPSYRGVRSGSIKSRDGVPSCGELQNTVLGRTCSIENSSVVDYLRGFGFLLAFQGIGWLLHRLGLPIPGGVLGLLAFYVAMSAGLVKLRWVERAANLMLRHMVLLFVPVTVGLIDLGPVLQKQALPILASLVISSVAVLLTTGLLGRWLLPELTEFPGADDATPQDAAEEAAQ